MPAKNPTPTFHTDSPAVTRNTVVAWASRAWLSGPLASCRPVMNRITPSSATGITANSAITELPATSASSSRVLPRITSEPPVRAPKAMCPAIPPAPWHMGTPPTAELNTFIMPVEVATCGSVTGRSGNRRLFSSRMPMTALPSVSGTWGRARKTAPTTRSSQPMLPQLHCGHCQAKGVAVSCSSNSGRVSAVQHTPMASNKKMPGRRLLRAISSATSRPVPASAHCCAISRVPCSMKARPRPNTMPCDTAGATQRVMRCASPVVPSTSQISPVTSAAPCTAPWVITTDCAAWVVATAPAAFMGCTGKGVR